jgi:non-canonical purine NTP pyrophosphatase (RdgB/HAM1 family)
MRDPIAKKPDNSEMPGKAHSLRQVTIVTGNPGKVRELQSMAMGNFDFVMHDLEITEIQSLDLKEIVKDKAEKAFQQIQAPVIVDDVSAGLDSLRGLPGPFIKYFNSTLGGDSLFLLSRSENEQATITCIAAYYDGTKLIIGEGTIRCTVVKPRGENGFGFDPVMVPEGQSLTMAEMTEEQKMQISHRGKAFRHLVEQLKQFKI